MSCTFHDRARRCDAGDHADAVPNETAAKIAAVQQQSEVARRLAGLYGLSKIFSENRFTLFGIML
jgi:hypothetical protein